MKKPADILQSFSKAEIRRRNWEDLWQECYEYAIPRREDFYTSSQHAIGDARMNNIYDETALNAVPEFASRMLAGIAPPLSEFVMLSAGEDVPNESKESVNRGLLKTSSIFNKYLKASNFDQEMYETMIEVSVGTGVLLMEESNSAANPFRFTSVPINRVWIEKDPFDYVGGVYYRPALVAKDIEVKWPNAKISQKLRDLIKNKPDDEIEIIDYTYRDCEQYDDEIYKRCILIKETQEIIYEEEFSGDGANPWIVFRWSKTAGELYGRGPLIQALPAIKTANLVKKLLLENAAISVSGIWQAEDDGVLNPETVILEPGTIIPKAPGSAGLAPLTPGGDINLSQFLLNDLQFNIRKALYNESLGRPDKTPMTATEVAERMADLARQIGSPVARLISEGMERLVRRGLRILRDRGLIDAIRVDNKAVSVKFEAPLAQAQRFDRIVARQRFLGDVQAFYGPESVLMMTKPHEYISKQAMDYGIDMDLINTKAEIQKLQQQAAQVAAQTQAVNEQA